MRRKKNIPNTPESNQPSFDQVTINQPVSVEEKSISIPPNPAQKKTESAMSLKLSMPNATHELKPRITVVGTGGAGSNAVNNMIRSNLEGVDFVVCNTDAQALSQSLCQHRVQLGVHVTQGLGAGARPEIGRAAAEESLEEVIRYIQNSNMVFIAAGMGGGTGTGAAPVIARAAREQGILTIGVVTKPFHFEGLHRMRLAEAGINELQQYVDTLIVIPNQNLFRIANEKTTFADAFHLADQVLYSGVRGVTDLMVMPGLVNLDFADIRTVMSEMGKAMMGTGEAEGENRAIKAAEAAISNPLLDDVSMKGARGVLINITGGLDMTLFEVDEAANRIREEVDPEANIIFGSTFDENLVGKVRISVVATGIESEAAIQPRHNHVSHVQPAAAVGRSNVRPNMSQPNPAFAPTTRRVEPAINPASRPVNITEHNRTSAPVTSAPQQSSPIQREQVKTQATWRPMPGPGSTVIKQQVEDQNLAYENRPQGSVTAPAAQSISQRPNAAPSLFARVSGMTSAQPTTPKISTPSVATQSSQTPSSNSATRSTPPNKSPNMATNGGQEPTAGSSAQPTLQVRITSQENRAPTNKAVEEILDIPAFLRRQAN